MASDSRISDHTGTLLDEGCKLFTLPVHCRKPTESEEYADEYFATELGLACTGGVLIYLNVYGTLVTALANLIAEPEDIPCISYVAQLVGRVTSAYVNSLSLARQGSALWVDLVIGGFCSAHSELEAYELASAPTPEAPGTFRSSVLDVNGDSVHFYGSYVDEAQQVLGELREADQDPESQTVAPLRVIRRFIEEPGFTTIGGDVQVGFTVGARFQRVGTVNPVPVGESAAVMRINSIALDELGEVGPCTIGIGGIHG
jgi:hypothetical protein